MTFRKERILENEIGSTRSPSMEKWLWKRLWTCGKTDGIKEMKVELAIDRHKSTFVRCNMIALSKDLRFVGQVS
jgi:hypothetical protein